MSPGLIIGILSALITLLTPVFKKESPNGEDCAKATAMLSMGLGGAAYHKRTYTRRPKA